MKPGNGSLSGFRPGRLLFPAAAVFVLVLQTPCHGAGRPIRVFTGIQPIAGLAERIGGDRVEVETLLRPGDNPHTFEPRPRQAAALGRADLVLVCGFPFERKLTSQFSGRSSNPVVADLRAGIRITREPEDDASSHEHGHGHAESDPHVWLSPSLLRILSLNLFESLKASDPASESYFRGRLDRLIDALDSLDRGTGQALAPYRGRAFLAAHPSFGWFAEAYGLKQLSVESEGKSPSARGLASIVREARKERVSIVFTEPQFDPSGAEAVAKAIGGTVAAIDPLGRDALATIRTFKELLVRSFREADAAGAGKP
jgi:zinc transport system substrate-binding protein